MTPVSLRAFLHEYRIQFPVGVDLPGSGKDPRPRTMRDYEMQGTPTLLFYRRNGDLATQHFGHLSDMTLGAQITALLGEPSANGLKLSACRAIAACQCIILGYCERLSGAFRPEQYLGGVSGDDFRSPSTRRNLGHVSVLRPLKRRQSKSARDQFRPKRYSANWFRQQGRAREPGPCVARQRRQNWQTRPRLRGHREWTLRLFRFRGPNGPCHSSDRARH